MKQIVFFLCMLLSLFVFEVSAQNIPVKMEELDALQFKQAVHKSSRTVIIPIGVLEKHGPHLPLGTDVYTARQLAVTAAEQDYVVVFPWYYFSQINEAKHQPGTISYSHELIWKVLQETLDELHRNGFDKMILVNGHGGNNAFLEYFCQTQLAERRNYSVYWYMTEYDSAVLKKAEELTMHDELDQHAGNRETSMMKYIEPNLVHTEKACQQSGKNHNLMTDIDNIYTAIWWYASYPNHYSGDGSKANAKAGKIIFDSVVAQLVEVIGKVKADEIVSKLQSQFFNDAEDPINTKQPY